MKTTKRRALPWCLLGVLLLLAALLLPFCLALWLPPVYEQSYYAALQDKLALLRQAEGEKTVVIGGSGVAFSVDPVLLQELCGQPCVNFGLYAAFGSVYMLELAEPWIGSGDTVVICPELSAQTCSMYFGADAVLQAAEGDASLLLGGRMADLPNLLTAFPAYLKQKAGFLQSGEHPGASGVYARSSFNEKGQLCYPREELLLEDGYQKGGEPTVDPSVYSSDFLRYLNRYAAKLERRGATVVYALPFMNVLSVTAGEEEKAAFIRDLREKLEFPLLCGFENRLLDPGYFYDSNYHTNDVGTEAATLLLAQDLLRMRGILSGEAFLRDLPQPLAWSSQGEGESYTTSDGNYRYLLKESGATLTGIPGLLEESGSLTLPETLEGYPLVAIGEGAFAGSKASAIFLPESVEKLGGRLFAGCTALRELHLQRKQSMLSVGDDLLEEFDGKLQIFLPASLYGDYATDYFWLYYASLLVRE